MAGRSTHLRLRLKVDDRMTALAGDTLELKRALRRELRRQRARVSAVVRAHAARRAALALCRTRAWRRARTVALYLAVGSELPTEPLIDRAWRQGKQICVPRVGNDASLRFVDLPRGARTRRNRYGIPEPARLGVPRPLQRLDLIVVPLVGFDRRGHRLGAGGGYYDRLLAKRRFGRPRCVGWALALQQLSAVPHDPWDQRLDGIVTERGIVWPTG